MGDVKYYIQDIETGEYLSVDSNKKITVDKDPYIWIASPTDADNEFTFKDPKSEKSLYDNGKEFGLTDSFDGNLWWTNAKPLGYTIDNVETKTQLNRQYGDKNEVFTFVRVEQNIKTPDVE